jgi:gas vesicle protein
MKLEVVAIKRCVLRLSEVGDYETQNLKIMARRNSFSYPHTCPKIDRAIASAKHTIQSYLRDYIKDLCPYIPVEKATELADDWGEIIYDNISDCFEIVRETNEDIRREAESQIDRLVDEISDLNEQIKELERQIEAVS